MQEVMTQEQNPQEKMKLICKNCGSSEIDIQVFQENLGSTTTTKTKSKYKEKGHGCVWWLTVGWWWWIVDLCLWIFLFIPRLLVQVFKKKKYKGKSTTVSKTANQVAYAKICTCKNCGHQWKEYT